MIEAPRVQRSAERRPPALGHIAARCGAPITSEELALWVNTNVVVVRLLLGVLRKAGLVASARARQDGWTPSRPGDAITFTHIDVALQPTATHALAELEKRACGIQRHLPGRRDEARPRDPRPREQSFIIYLRKMVQVYGHAAIRYSVATTFSAT